MKWKLYKMIKGKEECGGETVMWNTLFSSEFQLEFPLVSSKERVGAGAGRAWGRGDGGGGVRRVEAV